MSLTKLVEDRLDKTPEQILAELTAQVEVRNEAPCGFESLYPVLGKDATILFRHKIRQALNGSSLSELEKARLDIAVTKLDNGEFNFSDNYETLQAIAPKLSAIGVDVPTLLHFARHTTTLIESLGLPIPTLSEIKLIHDKKLASDDADNKCQRYKEMLLTWNGELETKPTITIFNPQGG